MRGIEDISQLEEIDSLAVMKWVNEQNNRTQQYLDSSNTYKKLYTQCYQADIDNKRLDASLCFKQGIVYRVSSGLLQSIKQKDFNTGNEQWRTLVDIAAIAKEEKKEWEFTKICVEKFKGKTAILVLLSEAGSYACVARELDIKKRRLKKDGFYIPYAINKKIIWYTQDSLLVCSSYGENAKTVCGYASTVRLLTRNELLENAKVIFTVDQSHMKASISKKGYKTKHYFLFQDFLDLEHTHFYLATKNNIAKYYRLPIPDDAKILNIFQDTALIILNSDWQLNKYTAFCENTLIGINLKKFQQNTNATADELDVKVWYDTGRHAKVNKIVCNNKAIFILIDKNLNKELHELIPTINGIRTREIRMGVGNNNYYSNLSIHNDELIFVHNTYVNPPVLCKFKNTDATLEIIKQSDENFLPSLYRVDIFNAISKDGTSIPYHVILKKNLKLDGLNPTIIYGYGGFGSSVDSCYLRMESIALLDQGVVCVRAHTRGGGEFGVAWHKAGMGKNKQNSFDDFIAIAEDLIARNITSSQFLGAIGESNGGLLVGACVTQRPELFKAAITDVGVFSMLDFHKRFFGACWTEEYGSPDKSLMRRHLSRYSPLHNLSAAKKYPTILIKTAKNDDIVHPYHSRAMAFLLQKLGNPVYFFEKKTGGHRETSFDDQMRNFTYWYFQLLIPAQRERKRQLLESNNPVRLFKSDEPTHKRRRTELSEYCATL